MLASDKGTSLQRFLREVKAIVILLMLAILKRTKMFIRYCTGAGTGGIRRSKS
jgi:hypothetical protein